MNTPANPPQYAALGDPLPATGEPNIDPAWTRRGYVLTDNETRQIFGVFVVRAITATSVLVSFPRRNPAPDGQTWLLGPCAEPSWPAIQVSQGRGSLQHPSDVGLTEWDDGTNRRFFGYDGSFQTSPVNPAFYLRDWKPHVARMMHGWEQFYNTLSYNRLSRDNRITLEVQIENIAGLAWELIERWERAVDANGVPEMGWDGQHKTRLQTVIEAICDSCHTETWARRMARNLNFTAFKAKVDLGQVWSVDTSSKPFTPGERLEPWKTIPSEISIELTNAGYGVLAEKAIDHYDEVTAHEDFHTH